MAQYKIHEAQERWPRSMQIHLPEASDLRFSRSHHQQGSRQKLGHATVGPRDEIGMSAMKTDIPPQDVKAEGCGIKLYQAEHTPGNGSPNKPQEQSL